MIASETGVHAHDGEQAVQLVRHGRREDRLPFVPHDGRREVAVRRVPGVRHVLEAHALWHQVVPGVHGRGVGEEFACVVGRVGLVDVELGDLRGDWMVSC